MSSHFSPKSLLFYGTLIGSVVILFRVVSGYGEATLKAPPNLGGYYLSQQSLPGCPDSTRFKLMIQQSGVYLYGALHLVEATEDTSSQSSASPIHENLTLRGLWQPQQLSLAGATSLPASCQFFGDATTTANADQKAQQIPVSIQGAVSDLEKAELTGQITLAASNPVKFTAIREAIPIQPKRSH